MARLFLKRTLSGFAPADEPSQEVMRKYKVGEVYRADVVRPRSYRHHCLAMALLQLTFDNQDRYTDFTTFRKAVALAAGYTTSYPDLDGVMREEAGSLSYDSIPDDVEFGRIISSMMNVCAHILHDMGIDELEAEVSRYSDEHYGQEAA